jgi:hypothetical protein
VAYEWWATWWVGNFFIPFHSILCGVLNIKLSLVVSWRLIGLMVKEIVFDVGRKIHHVPWKYGRYFLFVLLIFLDCLVQEEY